jgi:uncharacterized membrane protein YedE/YeeE
MENFTPVSATAGGILIGLSVLILLFLNGRMAGISGIMNGLLNFNKPDFLWRLLFLIGLIAGAWIFEGLSEKTFEVRENYPIALIVIGGFLVGFGTRLGSGCTSGHGICGLANLSVRSIAATLTFMATGIVTVFILKHLMGIIT